MSTDWARCIVLCVRLGIPVPVRDYVSALFVCSSAGLDRVGKIVSVG